MRNFSLKVVQCDTWQEVQNLFESENEFLTDQYEFKEYRQAGQISVSLITMNLKTLFSLYYRKLNEAMIIDLRLLEEIKNNEKTKQAGQNALPKDQLSSRTRSNNKRFSLASSVS
jgi:hypothetical protein